jgi:hypothetical protein
MDFFKNIELILTRMSKEFCLSFLPPFNPYSVQNCLKFRGIPCHIIRKNSAEFCRIPCFFLVGNLYICKETQINDSFIFKF